MSKEEGYYTEEEAIAILMEKFNMTRDVAIVTLSHQIFEDAKIPEIPDHELN